MQISIWNTHKLTNTHTHTDFKLKKQKQTIQIVYVEIMLKRSLVTWGTIQWFVSFWIFGKIDFGFYEKAKIAFDPKIFSGTLPKWWRITKSNCSLYKKKLIKKKNKWKLFTYTTISIAKK